MMSGFHMAVSPKVDLRALVEVDVKKIMPSKMRGPSN
jgi:hypothetical protein